MKNNSILDEHGMLTEFGRRIIGLALRDSNTAKDMFNLLRVGINDKIRTCENSLRGFQKLAKEQILTENLKDMFFVQLNSSTQSLAGVYRDLGAILDIEEIINQGTLEPKPADADIQDAVQFYHENKDVVKWLKRDLDDRARGVTEQ